jgi:hypothetical protein
LVVVVVVVVTAALVEVVARCVGQLRSQLLRVQQSQSTLVVEVLAALGGQTPRDPMALPQRFPAEAFRTPPMVESVVVVGPPQLVVPAAVAAVAAQTYRVATWVVAGRATVRALVFGLAGVLVLRDQLFSLANLVLPQYHLVVVVVVVPPVRCTIRVRRYWVSMAVSVAVAAEQTTNCR